MNQGEIFYLCEEIESNKEKKLLESYQNKVAKLFEQFPLDKEKAERLFDIKNSGFKATIDSLKLTLSLLAFSLLFLFPFFVSFFYPTIINHELIFFTDKIFLLFFGSIFFLSAMTSSYIGYYLFCDFLDLKKNFKKIVELKKNIIELVDKNPQIINNQTKLCLDWLNYHLFSEKAENEKKLKEAKIKSDTPFLKLKHQADLLILKRLEKIPKKRKFKFS